MYIEKLQDRQADVINAGYVVRNLAVTVYNDLINPVLIFMFSYIHMS